MNYYKLVSGHYIIAISIGGVGIKITKNEYNRIASTISQKPTDPEGYVYVLKTDLTWELCERPPAPPEDEPATEEDYIEALNKLGVEV